MARLIRLLLASTVLLIGAAQSFATETREADPQSPDDADDGLASNEAPGGGLGGSNSLPGDASRPQPMPSVHGKRGEWVIAPIPTYNNSQTWGLQLVTQYIDRPETQAPGARPDIISAAASLTGKGSYVGSAAYVGHFRDDLWRLVVGGGLGVYKYDFYGIGADAAERNESVPLAQRGAHALAQLTRRLLPGLYVGGRLSFQTVDITVDGDTDVALPTDEFKETAVAAGVKAQYDTRDSAFYPRSGMYANLQVDFFSRALGSDREFQIVAADFNQYRSLGTDSVLAWRFMLRDAIGDVPFYELSRFGSRSDLRGYKSGQFRDKAMSALQAEYRYRLSERWGLAAFAGIGGIGESLDQIGSEGWLPAGGAGVRYRLARHNPVDMRFDFAVGKGTHGAYLSVGQAF